MRAHEHRPGAGLGLIVHPEGGEAVPGGMLGGHIQHFEIVAFPLHLGAFDDLEAHADEDIADLFYGLGGEMKTADLIGRAGEGNVYLFEGEERLVLEKLNLLFFGGATAFEAGFDLVGTCARGRAFHRWGHRPKNGEW